MNLVNAKQKCEMPSRRTRRTSWFALVAALGSAQAGVAFAADYVSLAVYPPQIRLEFGDDAQRVIAVATRTDGVTVDVTSQVAWSRAGAGPEIVKVEGAVVRPVVAGQCRLQAKLGELTAEADAETVAIAPRSVVTFRHDVMPILMRSGCNAGGCHGSALGKDGFMLSLFGYDPAGDLFRLTRQISTRRIDLAIPEESLLLLKATGAVPHSGGKRIEVGDSSYEAIRQWIAAGATDDGSEAPRPISLEVFPPKCVLEANGATQQFVAVARYSNGELRNVTDLVVFLTNNDASAAINPAGLATAKSPGEAFVTARFDVHTVGSQALVLDPAAKYEPSAEPAANYVDKLVEAKLAKLRISPSELCGDEEFLRRATVDLAGRLPTPEERIAFLADAAAAQGGETGAGAVPADRVAKRLAKVDELLASDDFIDVWTLKWAEMLLVRSEPNIVEPKPAYLYWQWLRKRVAAGTPADALVRELLSASGSSFTNPPVNFYQIEPDPKKLAENVAQSFLGIRVQCAQCHNHPFDRWTMNDYYGFTAFFTQIARKRTEDYREIEVFNSGGGEVPHPVTGQPLPPKFLGGAAPDVAGKDRRAVVAEWVTSPDNPYFAANIANRAWAHLMGQGIVDQVDDVRVSNPASNPELLDALAKKLVADGFDVRMLLRDIASSNAYQRSSRAIPGNADDQRNFARAAVRRIPAEALLDCLCQATGVPEGLPGLPAGSRALEIADGQAGNYFLKTFGRSRRTTVCACEAQAEPTLSQALHLLNGSAVQDKINQGQLVEKWLDAGQSPTDVVASIYLRTLGRTPTAEESASLVALCGDNQRPVDELKDVFWAVLNSREFLFLK